MGLLKELFIYSRNNCKDMFKKFTNILPYMVLTIFVLITAVCLFKTLTVISINIGEKSINNDNEIIELNNKINTLEKTISNMNIKLVEMTDYIDTIEIKNNSDIEIYKINENFIPNDHARIGIKIMSENGINPTLLFAIIDARSNGDLFKTIPDSTAKGYGLMIESTARWVYEDIMNENNYTHDIQNDGSKSIEILSNYIVYLMKVYDGDIEKVLYSYVGNKDEEFVNEINDYLEVHGINIEYIEYTYKIWGDSYAGQ